jgi:hypothetical protein
MNEWKTVLWLVLQKELMPDRDFCLWSCKDVETTVAIHPSQRNSFWVYRRQICALETNLLRPLTTQSHATIHLITNFLLWNVKLLLRDLPKVQEPLPWSTSQPTQALAGLQTPAPRNIKPRSQIIVSARGHLWKTGHVQTQNGDVEVDGGEEYWRR